MLRTTALRIPSSNVPSLCTTRRASRGICKASPSDTTPPVAAPVTHVINVIPNNGQWPNGIPPVMGAHLMASGYVAPTSTSKGPGMDVAVHEFQYHDKENDATVVLHASAVAAVNGLTRHVTDAAASAIKAKGSFTLVLSGGSLLNQLAQLAVPQKGSASIAWDKVHIFFADERNVSHLSPDSNYKGALESFLGKVPIPAAQVHTNLQDVPVRNAAVQYEGQLMSVPPSVLPINADGLPVFDLILLGVGPDGHTASLFPNRAELAIVDKWVLPVSNSPKPPAERITLSLPVINAGKEVMFVAVGAAKAEVVQRVLEVQALPGSLPAQLVRPKMGKLWWLLDVQSAQFLDIASWGESKRFPRSM